MKKIILATSVFASGMVAQANNKTIQELKDGFELRADMYEVSQDGKKILSGPELTNHWVADPETGMIRGGWSSGINEGLIAFMQEWRITPEGSLAVMIAEFSADVREKNESQMAPKDVLEKKEFVIKNMEPFVWEVKNIKNKKFIVRFIPSFKPVSEALNVQDLPIAGDSISIYDDKGFLWAKDLDLRGNYAGFTTHRGTLMLSYKKFKGAREMGQASGAKIVLNPETKMTITLESKSSFLPSGMVAKVYAKYLPEKKSKGPNSVGSFDSSKEENFLKRLDR